MLFFAAGRVPEQDRLGSVLELAVEKDGALNRLHLVLGIVLLVGDEETRVQVLLVRQRVAFLLRRTVHEIALLDRLVQTGVLIIAIFSMTLMFLMLFPSSTGLPLASSARSRRAGCAGPRWI